MRMLLLCACSHVQRHANGRECDMGCHMQRPSGWQHMCRVVPLWLQRRLTIRQLRHQWAVDGHVWLHARCGFAG